MLTHIHIKNFAIVKSLSLDFEQGLHVLTGETGTGKSIWIDAIEIGLGGRFDAKLIYPNENTCDITLCFDLQKQPRAKAWLASNDIHCEHECIVRRIIDREKPSRSTINGTPVPQQLVRTFAEFVLCLHGQHQSHRLLKTGEQRNCLDRYAENEALLADIQAHYATWKKRNEKITLLKAQSQNKTADLTLWQYQLNELSALALTENEYETLFSQYQQGHRNKQFASHLQDALTCIEGEPIAALMQSQRQLEMIRSEDAAIANIQQLLQTAVIHADEARDALQKYCQTLDCSDVELNKIEKRLTQLQDIARKHHIDPSALNAIEAELQEKIMQLEKADEVILSLEKEQAVTIAAYQKTAETLTARRAKTAKKLAKAITEQMQTLGMNGGVFDIVLEPTTETIHPDGHESISFVIATNPGQAPHPLSQIVSGGELSRLSLLIQVLTAEKNNTPTLIFDEVDVGIGGKTADLVGRLLRTLSQQAQVLCVTHLPQVAAHGHHHYKAEKTSDGKTTETVMRELNMDERTAELARMLSGADITEKSVLHAQELLALHSLCAA